MFAEMTRSVDFHSKALVLRAERQRVIASNIANADTPGYVGRDVDFKAAMSAAVGESSLSLSLSAPQGGTTSGATHAQHIPLQANTSSLGPSALAYTIQTQPAMDGNSVDMDRERANFVDNSVRYEATLRFINGSAKGILSAIQGQ
jgi:flagellar basal-body rod protein FlgB